MASVVCPNCGSVGYPKNRVPGSFVVELLLWIITIGIAFAGFWPALVAALAYSMWRIVARQKVCRECGEKGLVPINSPRGKELTERYSRPPEHSARHPPNQPHGLPREGGDATRHSRE